MGSYKSFICRRCGARFGLRDGGGFFFDLLHCDGCGADESVAHQDLGDIHLRFVKGLPGPYAVARSTFDRQIQLEYPGESISRDEYRTAVEATFGPCACGGTFRDDARARCPTCRSTEEGWERDPDGPMMYID